MKREKDFKRDNQSRAAAAVVGEVYLPTPTLLSSRLLLLSLTHTCQSPSYPSLRHPVSLSHSLPFEIPFLDLHSALFDYPSLPQSPTSQDSQSP